MPHILSCDLRKSSMSDIFSKVIATDDDPVDLRSDEYLRAADNGEDNNKNRYPWLQSTAAMMIRKLLFSVRDYVRSYAN